MSTRATLQRGYVLHARSYRESSLLLDCLTLESGRISLIAKGARRSKGQQRRLLQPFAPLLISFAGYGELRTLTAVEEAGSSRRLQGDRLACGLYINELMVHLLPREEPVEELFAFYNHALESLSGEEPVGPFLRRFELQLLEAMGVAPNWGRESSGGSMIDAKQMYALGSDGAMVPSEVGEEAALIPGEVLLALASGRPDTPEVAAQCKRVLRYFIQLHLGGRKLKSRELLRRPAARPVEA